MSAPEIEALLFDLGGVVIDVDFDRVFRHWASMSSLSFDEIRSAFCFDPAYERHERGEICASEYFATLRSSLDLNGSDDDIACGWNAIFGAPIEESLAAVAEARKTLSCYAFTNTNPTHQIAWSSLYPAVLAAFDRIFVSSELGLRKPERAAFEAVADAIGARPDRILFFDDNLENVEGAIAAGLHAVLVRCSADLERALAATVPRSNPRAGTHPRAENARPARRPGRNA